MADPVTAGADDSTGQGGVTFTPAQQEEINNIVSKRVNETKEAVTKEFEPFRVKAQQLDLMLDDGRVQKFLMDEATGAARTRQTGAADLTLTQGDELPELSEIKRIDPDLAPHIEKLVDKLATQKAEAAINPLRKEIEGIRLDGSKRELDRMMSDKENYPYLQDLGFQGQVARYLTEGRAMSLPDAYNLARVEYIDQGKLDSLPKPPSIVAKEKADAELLESKAGTGTIGGPTDFGGEKPPKFDNAHQAAEWAMKKLGFE